MSFLNLFGGGGASGGGFFGSGADSSVTDKTTITTTDDSYLELSGENSGINDINRVSNIAEGAVVTIERTDYGALDTASKISELSFGAINEAIDASTGASQASVAAMKATALDALDTAAAANELDSAETMKYLIVTAGVIGVAYAWMRVKGG